MSDARPSWATDARQDLLDSTDYRFRFRFSVQSPSLLSVAHTVSVKCVTPLSAYVLRPKVKLLLSVDLYSVGLHPHNPQLLFISRPAEGRRLSLPENTSVSDLLKVTCK